MTDPTSKEVNCNACKDEGPGCLWCGRGKPEAVPPPAKNADEAWDQIMERLDDWHMKEEAKAIFLAYCDEKRRAALEKVAIAAKNTVYGCDDWCGVGTLHSDSYSGMKGRPYTKEEIAEQYGEEADDFDSRPKHHTRSCDYRKTCSEALDELDALTPAPQEKETKV